MTCKLVEICIDSNDPFTMANFWSQVLDWKIEDEGDGEFLLVPTDGTPFDILLALDTNVKKSQNRIHFDITTTTIEEQNKTVERLLALGARHIDIGQKPDEPHVVLADPEGNELCIIEPNNKFLSNTGRIGAINCDGNKETGYFWSEVLGWPLVWDQDGETAIQSPDGTGPKITWSGPPLKEKIGKNRIHFDIASTVADGQGAELERLLSLGARHVDIGQGEVSWVVLADPDGNEFCLLHSAE